MVIVVAGLVVIIVEVGVLRVLVLVIVVYLCYLAHDLSLSDRDGTPDPAVFGPEIMSARCNRKKEYLH